MGKVLDGFPWWSQLTDPDPRTHRPDVFATTDCGEEVVSIWIAGKTGRYTAAADLRRDLPGVRADGRTTGQDLANLLAGYTIVALDDMLPPRALKAAVHRNIDQERPIALLGRWIDPDVLHWILGIGYGNDALLAMEPWTGRLVAYRWMVVESLATGETVH